MVSSLKLILGVDMPCEFCKREVKIIAKGLCGACYQRKQKSGSSEYRRKRTFCSIMDCGKPAVSHGLCDKHRNRLRKHGDVNFVKRPDDWGAKHKHPMYNSWAWMRRHRGVANIAPEWANDFLQFAVDIGARPSAKHKLFAADEEKPIGPKNFVWKRAVTERSAGEDQKTYAARAQRVYRRLRPEAYQAYGLKKNYGLSQEDHQAMHDAHDGRCSVCGQAETLTIRGKKVSLAVDHCHASGHIRGLLCSQCNRGLGLFLDNPERLRAAADYLERNKRPA